jgi:hypothetical protein
MRKDSLLDVRIDDASHAVVVPKKVAPLIASKKVSQAVVFARSRSVDPLSYPDNKQYQQVELRPRDQPKQAPGCTFIKLGEISFPAVRATPDSPLSILDREDPTHRSTESHTARGALTRNRVRIFEHDNYGMSTLCSTVQVTRATQTT